MGNQRPADQQDNIIGEVEQSNLYAYSSAADELVPVQVTKGGRLRTAPQTEDNTSLTVTSDNNDQVVRDGVAIDANGTVTVDLVAEGAAEVRGKVVCNNTYDVEVRWLDSAGGSPLFSSGENIQQGQSGGQAVNFTQKAYSPYARLVVTEASGAAGTVTLSVNIS
jgi:hypothetical protein